MKIFAVLTILVLLLIPVSSAYALDPLVVCGLDPNNDSIPEKFRRPCTPCMLLEQIKAIIDFITITLVPIVAIILFLVSGIFMIFAGANPEMLVKGRSMLTMTVIGIVIIYGSYMVTNAVLQLLAGDDDRASSWFKIECKGGEITLDAGGSGTGDKIAPPGAIYSDPPIIKRMRTWNPPAVILGVSLSDADARQYLKSRTDGQVKTDAFTNCAENSQVECGSFEGARISTLDEIVRLQKDCNCFISVNDATGAGHKGEGHPAGTSFDLQRSGTIDAQIRLYGANPAYSDGQHFIGPTGALYWEEDSGHWHVEVPA